MSQDQNTSTDLKELLEREANLGATSLNEEEAKASVPDDEEEIMTTTRRRRLVKRVPQEEEPQLDTAVEDEKKPREVGGRRLRRVAVKKPVVVSSDDEANDADLKQNEDDEDDFTIKNEEPKSKKKTAKKNAKKSRKLTNGAKTRGESADEEAEVEELVRTPPSSHHASEDEAADEEDVKPKARKTVGKKGAAAKGQKAAKKEADLGAVNVIKSRNRLVGDMMNNDLYASDDDIDNANNADQEMMEVDVDQQLDLGMGDRENAPKKQFNFFNKAAQSAQIDAADLNAKIQQLGFSRETNVNELAARGVKLSFRDDLIRKMQIEEKLREEAEKTDDVQPEANQEGQEEVNLIKKAASHSSQQQSNLRNLVDKFCEEAKTLKKQKPDDVQEIEDEDEDSADEGLEFIDPVVQRKTDLAQAVADKIDNTKPQMVKINGKLVPAQAVSLNAPSLATGAVGQQTQASSSGRYAMLNQLRHKVMQKTSKNIDIAQIQSTFKTQDLQSKKKEDVTVEDALAHDLEKGTGAGDAEFPDDDDDESYREGDENNNAEMVDENQNVGNWDDEENIKSITEGDLGDCVQSSEDLVSNLAGSVKASGKATPVSVAAKSNASQVAKSAAGNESMEEDQIAEALNVKSNESSMGVGDLLRRKQAEHQQLIRAQKAKKQKSAAAAFMDLEADLGSDNEENDDRIKKINLGDVEEDENGLDDSLDGFVDHEAPAGDAEEIEAGDQAARDLFMAKQAEDERAAIKQTLGAVFYGQNKKRKRGEIEFEDMDDQQKLYYQRREERLKNELLDEDQDLDLQAIQDREAEKKILEDAEDEMSDEEVKQQIEQYKLFKQKRVMKQMGGENSLYNRYTNVAAKQKQEDAHLDNFIVDMTQTKTVTASQGISQATFSLNSSKAKVSTTDQTPSGSLPQTSIIDTTGGAASRRKPALPQKFGMRSGPQMLDRKKVVSDVPSGSISDFKSTAATSKTDKSGGQQASMQGLRATLRAKRQVGGSSMMSLVKTSDNQAQGAAAKTKRPVLFGSFKK